MYIYIWQVVRGPIKNLLPPRYVNIVYIFMLSQPCILSHHRTVQMMMKQTQEDMIKNL